MKNTSSKLPDKNEKKTTTYTVDGKIFVVEPVFKAGGETMAAILAKLICSEREAG